MFMAIFKPIGAQVYLLLNTLVYLYLNKREVLFKYRLGGKKIYRLGELPGQIDEILTVAAPDMAKHMILSLTHLY